MLLLCFVVVGMYLIHMCARSNTNPQRPPPQQAFPLPEFLARLGLARLAPRLVQEGVTLEHLRIMREGDLERLGVDRVRFASGFGGWLGGYVFGVDRRKTLTIQHHHDIPKPTPQTLTTYPTTNNRTRR